MTSFIYFAALLSLAKCLNESEEAQRRWTSRCPWTSWRHALKGGKWTDQAKSILGGKTSKDGREQWGETMGWFQPWHCFKWGDKAWPNQPLALRSSARHSQGSRPSSRRGSQRADIQRDSLSRMLTTSGNNPKELPFMVQILLYCTSN